LTREEIEKKIHWNIIFWIAGLVNMGAMLPQLYQTVKTRNVEGISLEMFIIFFFLQLAFGLQGFFRHDKVQTASMGLGAVVTVVIIGLVFFLREGG